MVIAIIALTLAAVSATDASHPQLPWEALTPLVEERLSTMDAAERQRIENLFQAWRKDDTPNQDRWEAVQDILDTNDVVFSAYVLSRVDVSAALSQASNPDQASPPNSRPSISGKLYLKSNPDQGLAFVYALVGALPDSFITWGNIAEFDAMEGFAFRAWRLANSLRESVGIATLPPSQKYDDVRVSYAQAWYRPKGIELATSILREGMNKPGITPEEKARFSRWLEALTDFVSSLPLKSRTQPSGDDLIPKKPVGTANVATGTPVRPNKMEDSKAKDAITVPQTNVKTFPLLVWATVIVAAIGLLWLLLKKRK